MKVKPLPVSRLCAQLPPDRVPWVDSTGIPRSGRRALAQPRALKALELALNIDAAGYNIYVSGEPNLGRSYMLREYLSFKCKKTPTPPDLIYVNNFEDPDKPILLSVPAGQGRKLKTALSAALLVIRKELPTRLEHASHVKRRAALQDKFQETRSALLTEMDKVAVDQGFNLDLDEQGGLTLYPLVEGKRLNEDEFEKLNSGLRQRLKRKGDSLLQAMAGLVRKLSDAERAFRADERELDRGVVNAALDSALVPVTDRFVRACPDNAPLADYVKALHKDILNNLELFMPREIPDPSGSSGSHGSGGLGGSSGPSGSSGVPGAIQFAMSPPGADDPYRYEVNVFVDNAQQRGAPVITEDNPTSALLLGCIERESEMGALVTDFTLIKAGSLHKANGGFLILRVEDILQHPLAWEGLLRGMRAGFARLDENLEASDGAVRTKSIEPQPMPMNLKVVLVGNEDIYESLLMHEPRFVKLFKIKAQMGQSVERTVTSIRQWLSRLANIIDESALLPFSREALAGLVDFGSRLCEDQRKLSLQFPIVRDVMVEANALTRVAGQAHVELAHLDEALNDRLYRVNLVEELYMEEYDRDMIKVHVTGEAVGRVNGLSVSRYGDFEFGLPHQISCTVGVGHDGIIDLEREAELGGPIHTKAMLILKSYLVDRFARTKPLVLSGSLCFEQNYGGIEGDSASGAELAALLSAISGVPIRLSLAFTGAVSQAGQIMAVGGVSRKIEGFFNVCSRRGLTGEQGVLIPADNVDHLMLPPRIRQAVAEGKFSIFPVKHITEALELLTGMPAGRPLKNDGYSRGSLYDLVDRRLKELGSKAAKR